MRPDPAVRSLSTRSSRSMSSLILCRSMSTGVLMAMVVSSFSVALRLAEGTGSRRGRCYAGDLYRAPVTGTTPPILDERDGPRDECGVFGVFAPGHDVARLSYFALYALQHRGQESAGIATAQGGHIMAMRDQGLVNQVFDEQKLRALQGDMAVGHVRYSTTGSSSWENAQPVWRSDRREVALRSTSDSEIIAALLSTHPADTIEDALADVMTRLEGAYSTVVMTKDRVVAFRDPAGLRPLSLGMLDDCYCVAS